MQIGDVVKLKAGGPLMTVQSLGADQLSATCVWFDVAVANLNGGVIYVGPPRVSPFAIAALDTMPVTTPAG